MCATIWLLEYVTSLDKCITVEEDFQMNMTDQKSDVRILDLGKYTAEILACEDRPLFEEAVKAARVGALRASYLMIWLSCAESLKRRFREAKCVIVLRDRLSAESKKWRNSSGQ